MRSTLLLALLAVLPAIARADVAPPPRRMIAVGDVHVVTPETDAPREEVRRATSEIRASLEGFLGRVSRCMSDHGFAPGRVRARIQFDRTALPSRARVVEGTGPLRACTAEVLPSIALAAPPHGRITVDATLVAIDGWR